MCPLGLSKQRLPPYLITPTHSDQNKGICCLGRDLLSAPLLADDTLFHYNDGWLQN
jgi:hypothetical protein